MERNESHLFAIVARLATEAPKEFGANSAPPWVSALAPLGPARPSDNAAGRSARTLRRVCGSDEPARSLCVRHSNHFPATGRRVCSPNGLRGSQSAWGLDPCCFGQKQVM